MVVEKDESLGLDEYKLDFFFNNGGEY